MKTNLKWVGPGYPKRWAFKKDMPDHFKRLALLVQFRFETCWIARDENERVYWDEPTQWAHTFDFYLNTPGHVIGLRDLTTANSYEWSNEWRRAMNQRIVEQLI
jgi:hypothetical protein